MIPMPCANSLRIWAPRRFPCNPTRKHKIAYDFEAYKVRNTVERCFNKLKHFRRIATRFDRRAAHFLGFIHLAAAILWLR